MAADLHTNSNGFSGESACKLLLCSKSYMIHATFYIYHHHCSITPSNSWYLFYPWRAGGWVDL